jgi:hypothetical protein
MLRIAWLKIKCKINAAALQLITNRGNQGNCVVDKQVGLALVFIDVQVERIEIVNFVLNLQLLQHVLILMNILTCAVMVKVQFKLVEIFVVVMTMYLKRDGKH